MVAVVGVDVGPVLGRVWAGDEADARARDIAVSDMAESDKRLALLRLALEDPRLVQRMESAVSRDDGDATRALTTLEGKILGGQLSKSPLDLSRIASGASFSGWLYKTFGAIAADASRKGNRRRVREVSINLAGGLDQDNEGPCSRVGEIGLGLAVEDDFGPRNPYRSIVMRRPMEESYLRAERIMSETPGREGVDAALDMLHCEGWVLSEETDRVDERLILSILMPRLCKREIEGIDEEWPGLGGAIAASAWKEPKKYRRGRRKVWEILEGEVAKTGVGSMSVWERVTHRLFDLRWFSAC